MDSKEYDLWFCSECKDGPYSNALHPACINCGSIRGNAVQYSRNILPDLQQMQMQVNFGHTTCNLPPTISQYEPTQTAPLTNTH